MNCQLFRCDPIAFFSPSPYPFEEFYSRLSRRGMVIYPGKLGSVNCFRVGTIGRLHGQDIRALLDVVAHVISEMGVALPVTAPLVGPG